MPFIRTRYFIDSPIKATKFLTQTLGFSSTLAQKTIDKARLRVGTNGEIIAHKSDILQGSIWLTHFTPHYYKQNELVSPIFSTPDFALFDKPAKILTHPKGNFLHKSLLDSIRFFCGNEAQSVHRLDFETSGAILVARHKKAQIELKNALQNRLIYKVYLAKVKGKIQKECLINAPIIVPTKAQKISGANLSIRSAIDYATLESNLDSALDFTLDSAALLNFNQSLDVNDFIVLQKSLQKYLLESKQYIKRSKPALTFVIPIYFDGAHTFIKAIALTGRTHQIRLHLAHIGHAIQNDFLYGTSDKVSEQYLDELRLIKSSKESMAKSSTDFGRICYADKILALHSYSLDFFFESARYKLTTQTPTWWQIDERLAQNNI